MFKPDHIVIHHSATFDGDVFNKDQLKQMHLQRGWSDIGYHAIVEKVGSAYEVVLGRPMTKMGAHAKGMNGRSFGICFVGNFSKAEPEFRQLFVGIHRWIIPTMETYNIHPDRVLRHSDTKPTECPGLKFPWDDFKKEVEAAWKAEK
jgi:N-acetyl-anhydromuramyl-L-alanine amidase AmpD